jgi:peptidoglycan LD-endopeptidase LytH
MSSKLTLIGTAIVVAVLTSAFWIFFYNIGAAPLPAGRVSPAGQEKVVQLPNATPVAVAEGLTVGPAGLAIPVAGVKAKDLTDTFSQARAAGARLHDAIDIMAPEGTRVIAAAPGTVEKLFFSPGGGGITVYIRSDDGRWSYYYAHLQGYAPGLKEGQRVERGQFIGTVGTTGNAAAAGPHLHFAIHRMSTGDQWHEGAPLNPYPLLAGKQVRG